jgi:hypothetical protein
MRRPLLQDPKKDGAISSCVTKCDEKRRAPRAAINLGESPSRRHMAPHSKRLKNFAKVTKSKICRQNRYVMVHSHAAKVRFLIARSTPWCIPGFIASTVVCCRTAPHHPPECGCRRRGRVSAVAAPHTVPVFRRVLCRRAVQIRPMRPSFVPVRQS